MEREREREEEEGGRAGAGVERGTSWVGFSSEGSKTLTATAVPGRKTIVRREMLFMAEPSSFVALAMSMLVVAIAEFVWLSRCCMRLYSCVLD